MQPLTDSFAERYAIARAFDQLDPVEAFAAAHPANSRQASLLPVRDTEDFAERAALLEAQPDVAARITFLEGQIQAGRARLSELISENNGLATPQQKRGHASMHRLNEPKSGIDEIIWYVGR